MSNLHTELMHVDLSALKKTSVHVKKIFFSFFLSFLLSFFVLFVNAADVVFREYGSRILNDSKRKKEKAAAAAFFDNVCDGGPLQIRGRTLYCVTLSQHPDIERTL